MDEKRVSKAEVEEALESELLGLVAPQHRASVLNRLFPPPPKSEYEKALECFTLCPGGDGSLSDMADTRHIWNAAIGVVERRLRSLGFKNVGDEIRKLRA